MNRLFYKLAAWSLVARQTRKELIHENAELKALVRQMKNVSSQPKAETPRVFLSDARNIIVKQPNVLDRKALADRWEARLKARYALKAAKLQAGATLIAGFMTLSTIVFTYLMSRNDAALKKSQDDTERLKEYVSLLDAQIDIANTTTEEERAARREAEKMTSQLRIELSDAKLERDAYKVMLLNAGGSWLGGIFHRWTGDAEKLILNAKLSNGKTLAQQKDQEQQDQQALIVNHNPTRFASHK